MWKIARIQGPKFLFFFVRIAVHTSSLLTEFEGCTVSYGPSFFLLDRRGKTRIRKVQYGLRKRG